MQRIFIPTKRLQFDARAVVSNPQLHHRASLRLLAWAALKAERGQTVRQHRLQAATTQTAQGGA